MALLFRFLQILFYFFQLPKHDLNDIASRLSVGEAQHPNNEMIFS
jgi:hypothetical protein